MDFGGYFVTLVFISGPCASSKERNPAMAGHLDGHVPAIFHISIIGGRRPDGDESMAAAAFMAARAAGVVPVFDSALEAFIATFSAHFEFGVGVVVNAIGLTRRGGCKKRQRQNKRQKNGPVIEVFHGRIASSAAALG